MKKIDNFKWNKMDWSTYHRCKEGLFALDPRFEGNVHISFEDGSYCHFENAFYVRDRDKVVVFTEHCGYHIFDACSVSLHQWLKRNNKVPNPPTVIQRRYWIKKYGKGGPIGPKLSSKET